MILTYMAKDKSKYSLEKLDFYNVKNILQILLALKNNSRRESYFSRIASLYAFWWANVNFQHTRPFQSIYGPFNHYNSLFRYVLLRSFLVQLLSYSHVLFDCGWNNKNSKPQIFKKIKNLRMYHINLYCVSWDWRYMLLTFIF